MPAKRTLLLLAGVGIASGFLSALFGVGGGVISGGRPLRGTRGYVGELGHLVVRPGGLFARGGAIAPERM